MNTIKVYFANGDFITTRINASEREISDLYRVGSKINIGSVSDNMQQVVSVEILHETWCPLMSGQIKGDIESVITSLSGVLNDPDLTN